MWPLECKQEFSKSWPGDLVFDPTWHIFEFGLDIVKLNILTKFDENRIANLATRVWTRISLDLTWWPSFLLDMTHIQTRPRYCQNKHSDQVSWKSGRKYGLYIVNIKCWRGQRKRRYVLVLPKKNAPMFQCLTLGTLKNRVCHLWWALQYLALWATNRN